MGKMHPSKEEILEVYRLFVLRSAGPKGDVELCAKQWIERMLREDHGVMGIAESIITLWETYKATATDEASDG